MPYFKMYKVYEREGWIMFKKIVFLVVVVTLFVTVNFGAISSMSAPASSLNFEDVGEEYGWAKDAINELSARGVVSGVGDNRFLPASLVTKEQIAAMLSKAFGLKDTSGTQTYTDVSPDRWSFASVEGTKNVLVKSQDLPVNRFDPERPVNRAEIAASCVKAMGLSEKNVYDKNVLARVFAVAGAMR